MLVGPCYVMLVIRVVIATIILVGGPVTQIDLQTSCHASRLGKQANERASEQQFYISTTLPAPPVKNGCPFIFPFILTIYILGKRGDGSPDDLNRTTALVV